MEDPIKKDTYDYFTRDHLRAKALAKERRLFLIDHEGQRANILERCGEFVLCLRGDRVYVVSQVNLSASLVPWEDVPVLARLALSDMRARCQREGLSC